MPENPRFDQFWAWTFFFENLDAKNQKNLMVGSMRAFSDRPTVTVMCLKPHAQRM